VSGQHAGSRPREGGPTHPGGDGDAPDDPSAVCDAPPVPGRLTVGRGVSLSGWIAGCERLVVEGTVRAALLGRTRALEVAEGGRFAGGRAEVEEAEVAGVCEGGLTVRGRLLVRRTGRVGGAVRYGELELEPGGELSGWVEAAS
jgi:cytoskeletal protein CcmA (bactofilin family)